MINKLADVKWTNFELDTTKWQPIPLHVHPSIDRTMFEPTIQLFIYAEAIFNNILIVSHISYHISFWFDLMHLNITVLI